LDFLKTLLDHGAEVNADSLLGDLYTPIQAATLLGRSDVVSLLLEYGADPDHSHPKNSPQLSWRV